MLCLLSACCRCLHRRAQIDLSDEGMRALAAEAKAAAHEGYSGQQVIHPMQVPIVQAAFSPTPDELGAALRLLEAYQQHQQAGQGAFIHQGTRRHNGGCDACMHCLHAWHARAGSFCARPGACAGCQCNQHHVALLLLPPHACRQDDRRAHHAAGAKRARAGRAAGGATHQLTLRCCWRCTRPLQRCTTGSVGHGVAEHVSHVCECAHRRKQVTANARLMRNDARGMYAAHSRCRADVAIEGAVCTQPNQMEHTNHVATASVTACSLVRTHQITQSST